MTEFASNTDITKLINEQTTAQEFDSIIEKLLTPEDKEILGEKAVTKARIGLLYMSDIPPAPALFSVVLYYALMKENPSYGEIPEVEQKQMLEFARRVHAVEDVKEGYLIIQPSTISTLISLFRKF